VKSAVERHRNQVNLDFERKHIAVFLSALQGGGAERTCLDLARTFSKLRHRVDLVMCRREGELLSQVPAEVRTVEVGASPLHKLIHSLVRLRGETTRTLLGLLVRGLRKKVRSLPSLEGYLQEERPEVLLASTPIPNLLALWAVRLAAVDTRLIIKQDSSITTFGRKSNDPFRQKLPFFMNRWYPQANGIIAVSNGIARELREVLGAPEERIRVIYNPIDLDRIASLAAEPVDDPWFRPGEPPVVLAAGRLIPQKDYPTLLHAFSRLRRNEQARLVILGEGKERPRLEAMSRDLNLAADIRLPGFQANPYAYMARAAVFVLSSVSEGLPTVVIEALACGRPVVSTDCPYGPAEILGNGEYGRLVPIGNPDALARAIQSTLTAKIDPHNGTKRAKDFELGAVAQEYLRFFFQDAPDSQGAKQS
jgi:glycosyltransferase involved in cell wall biosynthesis